MTDLLSRLAEHHGLTLAYHDPINGGTRPVPDTTKRLILDGLGVDLAAEPTGPAALTRIEVPETARCWLPPTLAGAPGWGIFCQLYELRSARNWGIGDFADLEALGRICAEAGADFLGINPVHALFTADPDRRSPFSPSNRRFLNPLYIAADRVAGVTEPTGVTELRQAELLDYPAIARLKLGALRAAFDANPQGEPAFDAFVAEGGEALRLHALFEAISTRMVAKGQGAGWRTWPATLQKPNSAAVRKLERELAADIRFHLWLQWTARTQLHAAAEAAKAAGMRIGLYLDLAVGEEPDGSSTWSGAAAALPGLSIGAPPDVFATEGQNWNLAAPSPAALARPQDNPFRAVIEAQLRDAGALRIDHAMALWQLFLVPEGASPAEGTHLRFPFAGMLQTLSDLSQLHDSVMIGEDLGYVPEGFRPAMAQANILAYRILYFEQEWGHFHGPGHYPANALACLSTHDLPVLAAWWRGEDIALRRSHGLVNEDRSASDAAHRVNERAALLRALWDSGALTVGADAHDETLSGAVKDAAHRFIARTPCLLAGVRLADLVGPDQATNLPGTIDAYPNWQPRSPIDLADIGTDPQFTATAALMRAERPRPR